MARRSVLWIAAALLAGCAETKPPPSPEIPVRVGNVVLDRLNAPVVLLEEENGTRVLPIWIGTAEATSIATEMNDERPPRPNFHDLAKRVIVGLDAAVERVVVTELRGGTYYATLTLVSGGREVEIDVRPSDGIAVALRTQAPILVRASVFEQAGEDLTRDAPEQEI